MADEQKMLELAEKLEHIARRERRFIKLIALDESDIAALEEAAAALRSSTQERTKG